MDQLLELDQMLLYYINVLGSNAWFDWFFPAITDLHKTLIFNLVAYPLFLGLFYWKFKRQGFLVFFGLLLCLGFGDFFGNHAFKKNFQRARPGDNPKVEVIVRSPYGGYSFTSNHATNMFALATYSSRFIPALAVPTFTIASLVGYSRIYNGVHFPLDVVVGGLFGCLWGLLFSKGFKKIIFKRTQPE